VLAVLVGEPESEGIMCNTLEVCNKTHVTKFLQIYVLTWFKFVENAVHTSSDHDTLWML
jgi:hypothetical protein